MKYQVNNYLIPVASIGSTTNTRDPSGNLSGNLQNGIQIVTMIAPKRIYMPKIDGISKNSKQGIKK